MLTIGSHAIVLWLHILGACIWIGGQIVVAAVIPLTRREVVLARALGRRFQLVAWPAFVLLVVTGAILADDMGVTTGGLFATAAGRTLALKLVFVLVSGGAALVHVLMPSRWRSPGLAALLGGVSVCSAIVAALYGVVLAGG